MTRHDSPLMPVRPDPDQPAPKRPASARTSLRRLLIPMALVTGGAFYLGSTPLILAGAVVWLFWIMRYILLTQVLDPSGSSTPSVNQHSNIGAMVARGEHTKAAEAYRAAIAADPEDVVACEQLALLALREMKDYELALFAYREAERRVTEPRRQLGYAIHIAGIYRDYVKDAGRTMVELRRVLARYPDAPNASALRSELDELKARHFETP
jgi:tetratricopeptide (TPR) repeat protein